MRTYNKGKVLVIGLLTFFFTGCIENLLNTTPYDQIASSTMWATEYLTELGVAGVYSAMRDGLSTGSATDRMLYQYDQFGTTSQKRSAHAIRSGSIASSDNYFLNIWKGHYTGITRANDLIHNMPEISPVDENTKLRYIAEGKFLRAYFYFRLNQLFKGVPVYLEEVTLDEMDKPRETEEEVWKVVLADLTDAINEPNLPDKYESGDANYGHVTKGAAYALRGKVYLYINEYEKAISDFEEVAKCGYALFQGGYKELFKEANEQCEEMIFSMQNSGVENYGIDTQFHCGSRSSYGSCWNSYVVTNEVVDLYENKDGTPFDWDAVIPGYSSVPLAQREVFFLRNTEGIDHYGTDEVAEITKLVKERLDSFDPEVQALYLPAGNEERIRKVYEENRDPRLTANVITPYATYLGVLNGADQEVTVRWPYRNEGSPVNDLRTDSPSRLFYLHRKFVYEGISETPNRTYCPTDFPIIRYADVLLMKAEALFELGKEAEARSALNEVRARKSVEMPPVTLSGTDLRDAIRDERRREFVNEGINFFDEMRWRTLKEKAFNENSGIKEAWGEFFTPYIWQGDHLYAWPIPTSEIQKNPNLKQNDGWGV
ncbi:MAG: RagB/SusD family nutrient uptake outer membrane protein [Tannerellaceae bacterium]|nr:RagB/SusD family nutrient uptake outer membrane protein [Tannerellaceae bacterium]